MAERQEAEDDVIGCVTQLAVLGFAIKIACRRHPRDINRVGQHGDLVGGERVFFDHLPLHPPRCHNHLPRPSIHQRLDEGAQPVIDLPQHSSKPRPFKLWPMKFEETPVAELGVVDIGAQQRDRLDRLDGIESHALAQPVPPEAQRCDEVITQKRQRQRPQRNRECEPR